MKEGGGEAGNTEIKKETDKQTKHQSEQTKPNKHHFHVNSKTQVHKQKIDKDEKLVVLTSRVCVPFRHV